MKVIVTNAHSRIAYRCIKALAEDGHEVIAGDFIRLAMSFYSKYSSGHFFYPSPYKDQILFLKHILNFALKNRIQFILPIHEETFIFSKYSNMIPKTIRLTVPDYKMILAVHNKNIFYHTAMELGIPMPDSFIIHDANDLDNAIRRINYPVVFKPRQGGGNYAIRFVHDIGKLREIYLAHMEENRLPFERLQIQEYLPVKEKYSQVMIFKQGEPIAKFTDLHLRDYPSEGGAGCLRVSTKFPEIEIYTEKILGHLKWHGIAEAEYIISKKDGKPYLIEINPRIWGGVNSAISSGINIPKLLLKMAFNENIGNDETSYRTGIKTRWLFGDLKTLSLQLKGSKRKMHTLAENLNIFRKDVTIDEFCKADPIPFMVHPISMMRLKVSKRKCESAGYYGLKGEWE